MAFNNPYNAFNINVPYIASIQNLPIHARPIAIQPNILEDPRARHIAVSHAAQFPFAATPVEFNIDRTREFTQSHGAFQAQSRDRGRDKDREHRDSRSQEDREKGRDRKRDKDKSRDGSRKHRDRSHSRDRSPVRESSPNGSEDSRSSDTSHHRYDEDYDRDRYKSSRDGERDRDFSNSGDDKGGDKWVCNQPSRTIILRGLNPVVDEKMIGAELMMLSIPVKDIRLIRKATGVSRGFAFVEFHSISDAQRWMDHSQGILNILNQYKALMAYSVTRDRSNMRDKDNMQRNDWVCIKCLGHNFKRRDYCRDCNFPRRESEKGKMTDGQDEVGTNPCNTLIFRGLDALTNEEGLITALTQALPSDIGPIKNVAVIRDDLNTSRGFGFVELHSVTEATQILEEINHLKPPLEVDGKQLLVYYARNSFTTTMATLQHQSAYKSQQYYDSGYYDSNNQQYYDYSQYYNQSSGPTPTTDTKGSNATNAAAAVAQAAIQQAQAVKNLQKRIQNQVIPSTSSASTSQGFQSVNVDGIDYPVYPPPDTTTYQYDETSGYYYDPSTQLYYDASSQYYYNSTTGQYMYWDASKSTYLPAPSTPEAGDSGKRDGKERKDKEKSKSAKKIAKDMEKWAKSMNAQKDKKFGSMMPPPSGLPQQRQESASADAGFAMLQKANEEKSLTSIVSTGSNKADKPGLVASYGGDSDSGGEEEEAVDESKLLDWTKLACLLCKRQFQSKEMLTKHTQMSNLHKENLEALAKKQGSVQTSGDKIEYRDRAKERREKYGAPAPPEPRKRRSDEFFEPPPAAPSEPAGKSGIGGENIGNKLLQKMGWSAGQGLGKSNQGRTDPIAAQRRNQMAGLGARGATVVAEAGDNYRQALKKTLYARYNELD